MELVTPRLRLRELRVEDAPAFLRFEGDPEVVRYQPNPVRSLADCEAYLATAVAEAQASPRRVVELGLEERATGELVGRTGLKVTASELGEASLWFVVRRDRWGRGLAPEAVTALVGHAFGALGLRRLVGECDPRNLGSARVMEKLRMRREAHFRENLHLKGEWVDSYVYALLAREWS